MITNIIVILMNIFRQPIWLFRGNRISIYARICKGTILRNCVVKSYAYIGRNCVLNNVVVESYCSIASNVSIGGMAHAYWDLSTSSFLTNKNIEGVKTYIGPDSWIASACVIKQGVSLGMGSVVGANSFLNKNTSDFSIWVGSPARLLKYRFDDELQNKIRQSQYWQLNPKKAKSILQNIY